MKLGPLLPLLVGLFLIAACGYRPAFGGEAPAYRLTVASAPLAVPHPEVLQAVLAGVRAELGKGGALESGTGFPRFVVEVLRVDEVASGIAASPGPQGDMPLGRASAVGVTVRGWIEEKADAAPVRDTGDVRRVQTVAQGADALTSGVAVDEAMRAAGRQAGEAVARRVLGMAEPAVEPM